MKAKYRVDNIPWFYKPLFWIFGYGFGFLCYILLFVFHYTCRIEFRGTEHLENLPNYIMTLWHHHNTPYFCVFIRHKNHVWMNHPAWFMKPMHVLIRLVGVKKLILGSTENNGKEASDAVVEYLKKGYTTFINPDGPKGPSGQLKKGVLHMSMQSGTPVLPVTFETPVCITLKKTWDSKHLPLPFSRIIVTYKKPVLVTSENFEQSYKLLQEALE